MNSDSHEFSALNALSPVDGRYHRKVDKLRNSFSEFGLIRLRLHVEIEWLIFLSQHPQVTGLEKFEDSTIDDLRSAADRFSITDAVSVKSIESTINHDVKAVETYLKRKFKNDPALKNSLEYIHFGLTSYDVNDNCFALMLQEGRQLALLPELTHLVSVLKNMANAYAEIPMLARTHGQPASPTTVGKEFAVFESRLRQQISEFERIAVNGKLSGATGNFNALYAAYPDVDWQQAGREFVTGLGLAYSAVTTQTEPHDYIAQYCHAVQRINTVLLDFCRDVWGYISLGYFRQKVVAGEVGSSTMPHKVNPIDFENAEGNLGLANAVFSHFADKLPISRWQRDLSDSTVLRNLGVPLGHSLIAYQSIGAGLTKLDVNHERLDSDLNESWEVLSEAVQTVLRAHGAELPYERLKALSRGTEISDTKLREFIESLDLPNPANQYLSKLTPRDYIGCATEIARSGKEKT